MYKSRCSMRISGLRRFFPVCLVITLCILLALSVEAQTPDNSRSVIPQGPNPKPEEAQKAILAAFEKHDVVLMQFGHGNKDVDDFILGLVRNPAFRTKVNDIMVEGGSSLYQSILDRYTAGEDVSLADVSHVWRDSGQTGLAWSTTYPRLVALVRQMNTKLPPASKLRVLAPEPPVDWSQVKKSADLSKYYDRNGSAERILKQEVLAKHRKALVLFGTSHIETHSGTIWSFIEKERPGAAFVIGLYRGFYVGTPFAQYNDELEQRIASWPVPSLVSLKQNSWLAELDQDAVMPPPVFYGCGPDGRPPTRSKLKASQVMDALLYLGPRDLQLSEPRPAYIALDQDYVAEFKRRLEIINGAFAKSNEIDADSPEGVLKFDQDPLAFNPEVEANYARLQAEASKHCTSNVNTVGQSSPQGSPQPGSSNPRSDAAPGTTFRREVPSGSGNPQPQKSLPDAPSASSANPKAIHLPVEVLKTYVGKYQPEMPGGMEPPPGIPPIDVAVNDDGLTVTFAQPQKFLPLSATEFFNPSHPGSRLTFTKNDKGKVDGFQLTGLTTGPDIEGPTELRVNRLPD